MVCRFLLLVAIFGCAPAGEAMVSQDAGKPSPDDPKSASAEGARQTFDEAVHLADEQHRQAVEAADQPFRQTVDAADEQRRQTVEAADKLHRQAVEAADAKRRQTVETAEKPHRQTVESAYERRRQTVTEAQEEYLAKLQEAMDAALIAKDLKQANEIDAAMKDAVKMYSPLGIQFVLIPAGVFVMGSPESEPGRAASETQRSVTLTQPFEMGIYEVTQAQYETVMGTNPSHL